MQPLSPPALLRVWEEGRARPTVERALLLLAHACPDESADAIAALPIGQRDARVLTLREWTFGTAVDAIACCPSCGERSELSFTIPDTRAPVAPALEAGHELDTGAYHVNFRVPDSRDMAELWGLEPALARRRLIDRCIIAARHNGTARPADRLPARVVSAVLARMGELDAQADVRAAVECPACAHDWEAVFDIVAFFWTELDAWAHRMLQDVHVLATTYSWTEAEILALSPLRRQYYLELVQA